LARSGSTDESGMRRNSIWRGMDPRYPKYSRVVDRHLLGGSEVIIGDGFGDDLTLEGLSLALEPSVGISHIHILSLDLSKILIQRNIRIGQIDNLVIGGMKGDCLVVEFYPRCVEMVV